MTYTFQNPSEEVIESYLKSAKTIAIVGLSHRKETAAYQVAHFLKTAGYRIVPVNPKLEGQEILGEHVYGQLKDIPFSVDIVDVFDVVIFCQMLPLISLKRMPRCFGARLALKMKKLKSCYVRQDTRIL